MAWHLNELAVEYQPPKVVYYANGESVSGINGLFDGINDGYELMTKVNLPSSVRKGDLILLSAGVSTYQAGVLHAGDSRMIPLPAPQHNGGRKNAAWYGYVEDDLNRSIDVEFSHQAGEGNAFRSGGYSEVYVLRNARVDPNNVIATETQPAVIPGSPGPRHGQAAFWWGSHGIGGGYGLYFGSNDHPYNLYPGYRNGSTGNPPAYIGVNGLGSSYQTAESPAYNAQRIILSTVRSPWDWPNPSGSDANAWLVVPFR